MSESKLAKVPSRLPQSTNHLVSTLSCLVLQNNASVLPLVFRDQLYKHLENVPKNDFDSFTNKLVQAGSTLDFLKYAEALFEIVLVGGLIQPGGSYVDDGAPPSPFTIFNAKNPAEVDDLKQYIEVLNKVIRRFASHVSRLSPQPYLSKVQVSSETPRGNCPSRVTPLRPSLD